MAAFEFVTVRGVAKWNRDPVPPKAARLAGLIPIACWILVIFFRPSDRLHRRGRLRRRLYRPAGPRAAPPMATDATLRAAAPATGDDPVRSLTLVDTAILPIDECEANHLTDDYAVPAFCAG
jgi:hypothetical protein